jgi:hypothetical protein
MFFLMCNSFFRVDDLNNKHKCEELENLNFFLIYEKPMNCTETESAPMETPK